MEEAAVQTAVWEDRRSARGWSGEGDGGRKASGAGTLDHRSLPPPPPPLQCSPRPGSPAGSPSAMAAACCTPAPQREAPTGSGGSPRPHVHPGGPPTLCPLPSRLQPEAGMQQVEWTNEGLSGRALQGALQGVGVTPSWSVGAPPISAHLTPRCATTHNYDRDRAWGYCVQDPAPQGRPGGCPGVWSRGGGDLLGASELSCGGGPVLSAAHPTAGLGAGGVGSGHHPPTHKAGSCRLWGPQSCSGYCWGHAAPCWSGSAPQGSRGPRTGPQTGRRAPGAGALQGPVLPAAGPAFRVLDVESEAHLPGV